MESLVALAAIFVGSITFYWARDLFDSTRVILTEPSPEAAMALVNQRYAFAKIIVLATLADGEVSEEEWALLDRLYREHPHFDDDPEQLISQLRFMSEGVRSREELERALRIEADGLDPRLRRAAFQATVLLASEGSGFEVRDGAYRTAPKRDAEGLVELLARALDISEEDRRIAFEFLDEKR